MEKNKKSLFNFVYLRYINICHNSLYKKLFTKKLTLFYCVLAWIIGFLNSLPNLTGSYHIIINLHESFCFNNMNNILKKVGETTHMIKTH